MKRQNRKKVTNMKSKTQNSRKDLMTIRISEGENEGEFTINNKCADSVKITDAMEYICQAVVDITINSILANPNTETVNAYMVKNCIMEYMNEKCNDMIVRLQLASEPSSEEEVKGDE